MMASACQFGRLYAAIKVSHFSLDYATMGQKVSALSLLALIVAMPTAQAAMSNIDQVTIYQGLASVTRSLPINAANGSASTNASNNGEQMLVFSCLSPNIDADSVSVQAGEGVNVGEIAIETLIGEQAALCQYQTDAKVQSQQQTLTDITSDLQAAKLSQAYLQNLTKASQVNIDGSIAKNAQDIEAQAAIVNKRIVKLEQQQAAARDALSQLISGNSSAMQDTVTQVSVRVASRVPSALKLHYQVRGASWQPAY
ncbi:MAG: DUF4140 domain-containing protein, partial [Psychrobacter sp.]|nr:DUF4140 domain-containing protein [Psychrobacter sp.]